METAAYFYGGDWVADCPRPDCSNAEFCYGLSIPHLPAGPGNPRNVRKGAFSCTNCQQLAAIRWPEEGLMAQVQEILALRPVPTTRNWYPADHPGAVKFRIPHGQTPADLRAENHAHGIPVHA